jgi:hypothetical protein
MVHPVGRAGPDEQGSAGLAEAARRLAAVRLFRLAQFQPGSRLRDVARAALPPVAAARRLVRRRGARAKSDVLGASDAQASRLLPPAQRRSAAELPASVRMEARRQGAPVAQSCPERQAPQPVALARR